jgi:hypothetical protein
MKRFEGYDNIVRPFVTTTAFLVTAIRNRRTVSTSSRFEIAALVDRRSRSLGRGRQKLRAREMPPEEEPQPPEHQRQAVAAGWRRARTHRQVDAARSRPRHRRASQSHEYNNTVRDLLGCRLRPATIFPQDDAGYGFDNIADVLSLSPVLMEKYVSQPRRSRGSRSSARRS